MEQQLYTATSKTVKLYSSRYSHSQEQLRMATRSLQNLKFKQVSQLHDLAQATWLSQNFRRQITPKSTKHQIR